MGRYIAARLIQAVPILLGITVVAFVVLSSMPGGPLAAYKMNPNVRGEDLQRLAKQFGLEGPVHVRYLAWLRNFVRGDWGYSIVTQRPVLTMITERFVNTLTLMGIALLLTLAVAIPVGVYSAVRQYSPFDYLATGLSFVGLSLPTFWLGLLLILLFSVELRWLPAGGMFTIGAPFSLADRARYVALPAATLAVVSAGFYTRYLRASVLDVLGQDFIRTARAKGVMERRVVFRHALQNAALPFATVVALHLPDLFTGAVVAETIFAWPGMGRLFWESALRIDYPVLMGILTFTAVGVFAANLLADVVYGLLDPRIRYA